MLKSRLAAGISRYSLTRAPTHALRAGYACRVTPKAMPGRLYAALRELDAADCAQILVEQPPEDPAWAAVRDRLRRAASVA